MWGYVIIIDFSSFRINWIYAVVLNMWHIYETIKTSQMRLPLSLWLNVWPVGLALNYYTAVPLNSRVDVSKQCLVIISLLWTHRLAIKSQAARTSRRKERNYNTIYLESTPRVKNCVVIFHVWSHIVHSTTLISNILWQQFYIWKKEKMPAI